MSFQPKVLVRADTMRAPERGTDMKRREFITTLGIAAAARVEHVGFMLQPETPANVGMLKAKPPPSRPR
jgi:hypothetical protein